MESLIPWEPFGEMLDLGSVFDRFFGRGRIQSSLLRDGPWSPAIDVYDKKDSLIVKAELPGMDKKDVKVSVDGDILTIKGESKKEKEVKKEDYYYSEIVYGSFYRTVQLPAGVQEDKAKAAYKGGVLTIDLPKSKDAKPKQIDIKVE